jgi:hypothetical protein
MQPRLHTRRLTQTIALSAAILLPLLSAGCGARVAVIGPPLFPPPIIAPGIGVVYYGGSPYYWDGQRYSYWDGHGYRGFEDRGPGYDHRVYDNRGYDNRGYDSRGYRRPGEAPRPVDHGARDTHHSNDHAEHSG